MNGAGGADKTDAGATVGPGLGLGTNSELPTLATSGLRLVSKLGQGGMAELFLGVQQGEQGFTRLVVVKTIKAARLSQRHLLGMFFDEAKTVAALSHPHIVKVFELLRTDDAAHGSVAIVMEYIDGETLSYVWKQLAKNHTHMPVPIVVKLVLDACEALGAAHAATAPDGTPLRLIHRDVSPQNLMLDRNGYLKIIDFGIAKSAQQTELTSPGGIKGKLAYLAPETFRTRDIDARVDVYGLGLILWELLTLRPAVDVPPDAPLQEVMDTVDALVLPPPSSLWSEVTAELDSVVRKATAPQRGDRYASMDDFAAALRKASGKTGLSSSAGVKKWFLATFAHRLEKRRAFEADAFARAERAAATTATTPPRDPSLGAALDARAAEPTPLTEVRASSSPSRRSSLLAAAAAALVLGAVVLVSLSLQDRTPLAVAPAVPVAPVVPAVPVAPVVVPAPAVPAVVPAVVTAVAAVLDAGFPEEVVATPAATKRTPTKRATPAPPTPPPPTTTQAPPTPEPAPTAPAPVAAAPPAPTTPTPTPTAPAPTAPAPKKKLLSGNGAWTGAQVLQLGCTRCHAVEATAKTRRQWERFFERDVHDRYGRLDEVFSDAEQRRALESLLLMIDGKAANSGGVAGVR